MGVELQVAGESGEVVPVVVGPIRWLGAQVADARALVVPMLGPPYGTAQRPQEPQERWNL